MEMRMRKLFCFKCKAYVMHYVREDDRRQCEYCFELYLRMVEDSKESNFLAECEQERAWRKEESE